MDASPRRLPLRLACALLLMAASLAAVPGRVVVYFLADFEQPGGEAPGIVKVFSADGGTLSAYGSPEAFELETESGDGVLAIGDNAWPVPAILLAEIEEPPEDESPLDTTFWLRPVAEYSDLIFMVSDDDDTGMIDVTITDDGLIDINGDVVDSLPSLEGGDSSDTSGAGRASATEGPELFFRIRLKSSMAGGKSYTVSVSGDGWTKSYSGSLDLQGPLTVGTIRVVRPPMTVGGGYRLDDLMVSSPGGGMNIK